MDQSIWVQVIFVLKKPKPMNIVKIGVVLFSIPAKPDEMPVSAKVNKNAGSIFPQIDTIRK